jgi:hypothetical protein
MCRETSALVMVVMMALAYAGCGDDVTLKPSSWPKFERDVWRMDYRGVALIAHSIQLLPDATMLEPSIEVVNETDATVRLLRPTWLFQGRQIDPEPIDESVSQSLEVSPNSRATAPYVWSLPGPAAEVLKGGVVVDLVLTIEDERFTTQLVLVH